MRRRGVRAFPVAAFVVTGCLNPPTLRTATTTDSAGVTLVDNRTALDGATPRYSIDSVPLVDIGSGTDPHHEFPPTIAVARLRSGQIVVAAGTELRWFDPVGRWVRSVGRNGSGPGEFRQIDLLALFGDSVLVFDLALRRASVFDSAGNYGRGTTIVDSDTLGQTFPVGVLSDGRLVLASSQWPSATGLRRDSVTIRIGSPNGVVQSLIGRFPYVDQLLEAGPRGVSMGRVAFGRLSYWGTSDSSVLVASNEQFRFDWYGAEGEHQRAVRRQWTPVPVTVEAVTAQIDEWLTGFPAGMEQRKAQARAEWAAAPRLEAKPPYGPVLVSATGEVWVQEYGEPGQRSRPAVFSVFDRSGQWLCQITLPSGVEPKVIGTDHIVATWLDQDDATHLRIYAMKRSR